jgi:hypothetical protein
MSAQMDSNFTASLLESGEMLANAGNVAAVIAGIARVTVASATVRLLLAGSMLCWLIGCWFAVRVRIDASLFRQLAGESQGDWRRLDELLIEWGFPHPAEERSASHRSRSAIALWRSQTVTLAIQLASLIAAVLLEATGI